MESMPVEAFRALARHGGFFRAARALNVRQPSLTRSVARLEAGIGFPLFLRGQGAAPLTPEGEAFLREVERAFSGLDRLRVAAQDIRNFGTGRLRLACLPALAGGVMVDALARFLRSRPAATVALHARPSTTVYEWVATRQADFGLAAPRSGFPAAEEEEEFLTLPGVLVVPRGHRLARRRTPVSPGDIAEEQFIALALEDGTRHSFEQVFRTAGVELRIRLETPYSATLCRLVAAGLGVALVNPLVAADEAHGLPIVALRFAPTVPFRYLLLRARGGGRDRLAEAFSTELLAQAKRGDRGG
ncbi:MAG TPA: LysR substrate-binding domain-containing protein [Falsiroseomonas sp.]|nr:LysR substrate-binding domain-containing protein [Falsiroseomonas sp.]